MYRPPQATIQPVSSQLIPSKMQNADTPPSFFKRLDKYIKKNSIRPWDVFAAMDHNGDKKISTEELLDGLHQIEFQLSPEELKELNAWMGRYIDVAGLSFKEFTLALKLRASMTSPKKGADVR